MSEIIHEHTNSVAVYPRIKAKEYVKYASVIQQVCCQLDGFVDSAGRRAKYKEVLFCVIEQVMNMMLAGVAA